MTCLVVSENSTYITKGKTANNAQKYDCSPPKKKRTTTRKEKKVKKVNVTEYNNHREYDLTYG